MPGAGGEEQWGAFDGTEVEFRWMTSPGDWPYNHMNLVNTTNRSTIFYREEEDTVQGVLTKRELIYSEQRLRGRTVARCEDTVASEVGGVPYPTAEMFVARSHNIP